MGDILCVLVSVSNVMKQ